MSAATLFLCLGAIFLSCAPGDDLEIVSSNNQFQKEFLQYVNSYRTKGCKCGSKKMPPVDPLTWNDRLAEAAQRHVLDMAKNNHFDHQGTDGSSSAQRISQANYQWRAIAENIAWGYDSVEAVVVGWISSKGHCENIMDPAYTEMGAAREGAYWTQTFGRPN